MQNGDYYLSLPGKISLKFGIEFAFKRRMAIFTPNN